MTLYSLKPASWSQGSGVVGLLAGGILVLMHAVGGKAQGCPGGDSGLPRNPPSTPFPAMGVAQRDP